MTHENKRQLTELAQVFQTIKDQISPSEKAHQLQLWELVEFHTLFSREEIETLIILSTKANKP